MKSIKQSCRRLVREVKNQIDKVKMYFLKRRLEQVFKETKETVQYSYNRSLKEDGAFHTYFDNTPDFSLCLDKDSTNSFSNKAFVEWQARKIEEIGMPSFPPIHRSTENASN